MGIPTPEMKILAIDDEETMATLYTNLLSAMGHHVTVAQTGAEALAKVKAEHFDLIILDLKLPDIHGSEALKQMKTRIEDAPVIIVTANPTLESSIDAIKTGGVYDYIIKPFSQSDLQMIIQRAVEKVTLLSENKKLARRLERTNQALAERVDELEKFAQVAVHYEQKISELRSDVKGMEKKLDKLDRK